MSSNDKDMVFQSYKHKKQYYTEQFRISCKERRAEIWHDWGHLFVTLGGVMIIVVILGSLFGFMHIKVQQTMYHDVELLYYDPDGGYAIFEGTRGVWWDKEQVIVPIYHRNRRYTYSEDVHYWQLVSDDSLLDIRTAKAIDRSFAAYQWKPEDNDEELFDLLIGN